MICFSCQQLTTLDQTLKSNIFSKGSGTYAKPNQTLKDVKKLLPREAAPIFFFKGSGTYAVEAVIQTSSPREGARVLVLANGAYGRRMARICEVIIFQEKELGRIVMQGDFFQDKNLES